MRMDPLQIMFCEYGIVLSSVSHRRITHRDIFHRGSHVHFLGGYVRTYFFQNTREAMDT